VLDARLAGAVVERSIAGQVEFWARTGRSVELLLERQQVLALCATPRLVAFRMLESVDSAGPRAGGRLPRERAFPSLHRIRIVPAAVALTGTGGAQWVDSSSASFSYQREVQAAMSLPLDRRPVIVALAGPNGAGKTTFYYATSNQGAAVCQCGRAGPGTPYRALCRARVAASVRQELVKQRESFVFETVFSDPVGEKLAFLKDAAQTGYNTILCFIGLPGRKCPNNAWRCVSRRAATMFRRRSWPSVFRGILANLKTASANCPTCGFFDNNDLRTPYRLVAIFEADGW